jgi:hypothetical protein
MANNQDEGNRNAMLLISTLETLLGHNRIPTESPNTRQSDQNLMLSAITAAAVFDAMALSGGLMVAAAVVAIIGRALHSHADARLAHTVSSELADALADASSARATGYLESREFSANLCWAGDLESCMVAYSSKGNTERLEGLLWPIDWLKPVSDEVDGNAHDVVPACSLWSEPSRAHHLEPLTTKWSGHLARNANGLAIVERRKRLLQLIRKKAEINQAHFPPDWNENSSMVLCYFSCHGTDRLAKGPTTNGLSHAIGYRLDKGLDCISETRRNSSPSEVVEVIGARTAITPRRRVMVVIDNCVSFAADAPSLCFEESAFLPISPNASDFTFPSHCAWGLKWPLWRRLNWDSLGEPPSVPCVFSPDDFKARSLIESEIAVRNAREDIAQLRDIAFIMDDMATDESLGGQDDSLEVETFISPRRARDAFFGVPAVPHSAFSGWGFSSTSMSVDDVFTSTGNAVSVELPHGDSRSVEKASSKITLDEGQGNVTPRRSRAAYFGSNNLPRFGKS